MAEQTLYTRFLSQQIQIDIRVRNSICNRNCNSLKSIIVPSSNPTPNLTPPLLLPLFTPQQLPTPQRTRLPSFLTPVPTPTASSFHLVLTHQPLQLKLLRVPHLLAVRRSVPRHPPVRERRHIAVGQRARFAAVHPRRAVYSARGRPRQPAGPGWSGKWVDTAVVPLMLLGSSGRGSEVVGGARFEHAVGLVFGPGGGGVQIEEDVDEEVHEEGDGVEDEDVGDVGDVVGGEEGHLLFGGAHEEETGCVEELKTRLGWVLEGG